MFGVKPVRILIFAAVVIALGRMFSATAQTSSSVAISFPDDPSVKVGSVICSISGGFGLCNSEYAPNIFGVIHDLTPNATANQISGTVMSNGLTQVRVSSGKGEIKVGDFVTSSTVPGVAQLATDDGYVLGTVIEAPTAADSQGISTAVVSLDIRLISGTASHAGNIFSFLRKGASAASVAPLDSLRYLLASLMVLVTFTVAMFYFGRASRSGVTAMGRNPLAQKSIQKIVYFNILLSLVMVLVGLLIAYLILKV